MNKIVLYFRRSKKYYLENKVDYDHLFKEDVIGTVKANRSVKMWNLCFGMKYMDFRNRFRDIAQRTRDRNDWDDVILYNQENLDHLEPGTLLFPIARIRRLVSINSPDASPISQRSSSIETTFATLLL